MGERKAGAANVHADREQVEEVTAEAKRLGAPLRILPAELDVSGGLPLEQRPSLREAVDGVENGRYAGIIVAYLSRLGRSVREQLAVWDRVEAAGGRIIVVREGIDTSTPSGRLQRTILLGVAEMELDQHTERFENLRQWATAAGIWQRRQTPRGYRRDPETRRLVRDSQADQIRQAFHRRAAGESISGLARDLGMTQSGVRALLRNRVYLGELKVGQHINPSAHPPIVTEDEYAAAQAARPPRPARSSGPVALLAGIIRCQSCGHVMSRSTGGRGKYTYACHRQHSAGPCPRPAAITLDTLDRHVIEITLAELAKLSARAVRSDRELDEARRAARDAERELAAYLEGVQAAGLKPGEWAAGARSRSEALQAARARHAALAGHQAVSVDGDPVKAWERMDPVQRNRLLRSLVECVIASPVGRGRRVPVEERVRVLAHGAGLVASYGGGGTAMPVGELPFPDLDDPVVLRI